MSADLPGWSREAKAPLESVKRNKDFKVNQTYAGLKDGPDAHSEVHLLLHWNLGEPISRGVESQHRGPVTV